MILSTNKLPATPRISMDARVIIGITVLARVAGTVLRALTPMPMRVKADTVATAATALLAVAVVATLVALAMASGAMANTLQARLTPASSVSCLALPMIRPSSTRASILRSTMTFPSKLLATMFLSPSSRFAILLWMSISFAILSWPTTRCPRPCRSIPFPLLWVAVT